MARRKEPADDQLAAIIREALAYQGKDESDKSAEAVMDVLRPLIGASAERRRNEGALRDAFKEGYVMGKHCPPSNRFMPWHSSIWKASRIFQALKAREITSDRSLEAEKHFQHYNV